MIARIWHGWTTQENADAYETLLRTDILPGIHRIAGYRGAYLLRREIAEGAEFITVTMFESLESIRAFAGPDHPELAVVPERARKLLLRFDARSVHYTVAFTPPA